MYRFLFLILIFAVPSVPAAAQGAMPSSRAWESCVGASAQDYIAMFGAVSMDADKIDKAVEDCWDAEFAFQQALQQLRPDLSAPAIHDIVAQRRMQIRNHWYDTHVTRRTAAAR